MAFRIITPTTVTEASRNRENARGSRPHLLRLNEYESHGDGRPAFFGDPHDGVLEDEILVQWLLD
jgi:hypothetical protein